jgi:uncharacterized protein YcbK (DUF882 family)
MLHTDHTPNKLNRRSFLGFGAVAAAAALSPLSAEARSATGPASPKAAVRALSFFNTHTGERLRTTYCEGGTYDAAALQEINYILRDFRADEVKPIDPQLLDLLHELSGALETDRPFHIISGYRSPNTNQLLRQRGGCRVYTSPSPRDS